MQWEFSMEELFVWKGVQSFGEILSIIRKTVRTQKISYNLDRIF